MPLLGYRTKGAKNLITKPLLSVLHSWGSYSWNVISDIYDYVRYKKGINIMQEISFLVFCSIWMEIGRHLTFSQHTIDIQLKSHLVSTEPSERKYDSHLVGFFLYFFRLKYNRRMFREKITLNGDAFNQIFTGMFPFQCVPEICRITIFETVKQFTIVHFLPFEYGSNLFLILFVQ